MQPVWLVSNIMCGPKFSKKFTASCVTDSTNAVDSPAVTYKIQVWLCTSRTVRVTIVARRLLYKAIFKPEEENSVLRTVFDFAKFCLRLN